MTDQRKSLNGNTSYRPLVNSNNGESVLGPHGSLSEGMVITDRSIAAAVCLLNLVLLLALICSRSKDKRLFRVHVINLTVISIFSSAVILVYAAYDRLESGRFDAITCKIFVFTRCVLNDALPLCLLEIHLDRFFSLLFPITYRHAVHRAIAGVMLVMPWIVAMAMTLPEVILLRASTPSSKKQFLFGCELAQNLELTRLTHIVRYIPPALVAVLFFLMLFAVLILLSPNCSPERDDRGLLLNSMVAILLVDVFFFLMQMITRTISLLVTICPPGVCISNQLYRIHLSLLSRWLHSANPGLNPILWLCDRDIRRGYKTLFCLECVRRKKRRDG